MASSGTGSSNSSVYVGNLDERVSERVLYDILIQAGRVVDLYVPRDKDSDRPKGYAFVEYESPEIAHYAVTLFSGLVTLYNRTLKFAISGQDKPSPPTITPASKPRPVNETERISPSFRLSSHPHPHPANHHQVAAPPGVNNHRSNERDGNNFEYTRRVFGSTFDTINRSRSRRFDSTDPVSYPSY